LEIFFGKARQTTVEIYLVPRTVRVLVDSHVVHLHQVKTMTRRNTHGKAGSRCIE
jgi:hypothetical protein